MNKKPETIADRKVKGTWMGRSLENYKLMFPKTKHARTLTEARQIAHGEKQKKVGVCGCGQPTCRRYGGPKSSNC